MKQSLIFSDAKQLNKNQVFSQFPSGALTYALFLDLWAHRLFLSFLCPLPVPSPPSHSYFHLLLLLQFSCPLPSRVPPLTPASAASDQLWLLLRISSTDQGRSNTGSDAGARSWSGVVRFICSGKDEKRG